MLEQEDPSDKTNILRSVQMYLNVVLGPFLSDLSLLHILLSSRTDSIFFVGLLRGGELEN